MNLGELLHELRENILHDRSDRVAGYSDDHLWSTGTLIRYINEAHIRMAVQGLMIRDNKTPEVCQVPMVQYQEEYALHPSIIAVISVRCKAPPPYVQGVSNLIEDHADLARAGHSALSTYKTPDTYFFNPAQLSNLPPGKVLAFDTDEGMSADDLGSMGVVTLRVYPKPKAPYIQNMHLRVVRKPLVVFKEGEWDAVPEIAPENHMDMLDWAAYLALRIVDHDAGDPARAEEFKESFAGHVKEARDIAMRKMFSPTLWGFGRNGFSWETN